MREAEYFSSLGDGSVRCGLCPHSCLLREGASGVCGARKNEGGRLRLPFYGFISSIALDPVEKKPLRRFLPGTKTFSVGFWHCTMRCPFCQNWEIAQPESVEKRYLSPKELLARAVASDLPSISFTYSEPCLHIEYVMECMKLARQHGLKTILVTNGNILDMPARDILSLTDATNVDLKSFSASTYHNVLGGELETVMNFIRIAHSLCHVEVTSLLVPRILDSPEQVESIATFIASISRSIPLHITPYHQAFRYKDSPVSVERMESLAALAYDRLDHVYFARPILA
ncbi:MAG: radical SAM protein [Rectinemataceae bacterium]|nr:radical SAM protein [Rectinemataceae bacterium]